MSLITQFTAAVAVRPKKVALITDKSQLTFEDILHLVHVFDVELTTRGIRPGQTIVLDERRPEFCIAMALLLSIRSLTVIFAPSTAVLALGVAADRHLVLKEVEGIPRDQQIVIEPGWFATMGTMELPDHSGKGGAGAFVFASSGTTGRPKLVRSSEAGRIASILNDHGFAETDLSERRFMTTLSLGMGSGLKRSLANLCAGGSVVALSAKEQILPYIDLYRVDTLGTTPAVAQMMLGLPNARQYLASLRDVRFGGSLASPELLADFSRLSPARLHLGYGAAEIGQSFGAIHDPDRPKPEGFIGQFLRDDLEIGFFDETRKPLPGVQEGVVGFRPKSSSFDRAYLSVVQDDTAGFHDGWFFPGDIMRREGEDFFLVSRLKNIVNVGGNKFSLDAVRAVLERAHPGSTMVPVMELGPGGIERLAVAYRSDTEITATNLTASVAALFRGLTVGRVLRVAEIPMTPSGKVDVQALKAQLG